MLSRTHFNPATITVLILTTAVCSPRCVAQTADLPTRGTGAAAAGANSALGPAERLTAELSKDARMALGAQALAIRLGDWPAWERATRRLVTLNDELRYHSRNKNGSQLARLKKTIEARLERAKHQLAQGAESSDAANDTLGPLSGPVAGRSALVVPIAQRRLAQQIQLPVQQGAALGGGGLGAQAAGPGQQADYADDLIALIESTISADIWQSVGGPASIDYYQPALALVISAPSDVHDGVVNLLYQLRRANGQ